MPPKKEKPEYKSEPIQIGCGYCKKERECRLKQLWIDNRNVFTELGFTTRIIALNCKFFKSINHE